MADQFSDSDAEDLFASPSAKAASRGTAPERPKTPKTPTPPQPQPQQSSSFNASTSAESREAALRRELEGVRQINELIEGVVSTLDRAKGNMGTVSQTVNTASTLLNTWTRILSQTEHSQRLILNPTWKGATADMADLENEAAHKQAAAERRAAEEQARRNEVARRREDEERQREAAATRGTARGRTTRGRATRGAARATPGRGVSSRGASGSAYGVSGIPGARPASGIGRGTGSVRGRPRGTRGT